MAENLTKMDRYDEAHKVIDDAIERSDTSFPVMLKFEIFEREGRREDALELAEESLQRRPYDLEMNGCKIDALCALGRYKDAIDMIDGELDVAPDEMYERIKIQTSHMRSSGIMGKFDFGRDHQISRHIKNLTDKRNAILDMMVEKS